MSSFSRANTALIIGLGLIGGSLAKALRQGSFADTVLGFDTTDSELEAALSLGVIDRIPQSLEAAVAESDLIVLAVPVNSTEQVLRSIKPHLRDDVVISDVGSTKGSVMQAVAKVFGHLPSFFVAGHPIAGSEKSGVAAANAQLFARHKVIVTPHDLASREAEALISRMWQSVGAEVISMGVEKHDQVLAATSHLPHILAFSLVDTLAKESENWEIFRYAAGGFRDFTRIAASDPRMWGDICSANKEALLDRLDTFTEGLATLREAIEQEDDTAIRGIFTRAKSAREHFNKMLAKASYAQSANTQLTLHVSAKKPLSGKVKVPGDKSISHRAIMLGALAEGVTNISGFLEGEDSLATLQAFRDMGVVIEGPYRGEVKITGVGLNGLCPPPGPLYLGNAGTAMRLLSGVLAAQPFASRLIGDQSLSTRPMLRIAEPLELMGAKVQTHAGCPPLDITPVEQLSAINYQLPMASAQVKSAILLAGLYAQGDTQLLEPAPSRDHTERMLSQFGAELTSTDSGVHLKANAVLKGTDIAIPGDLSSAAFFIVAAAITPGSNLVLPKLDVNPSRTGVIDILRQMGADISFENPRELDTDPVADIHVSYAHPIGIATDGQLVPRAM